METTHTTAEVLIPDEVIDDRFRGGSDAHRIAWAAVDTDRTPASRRQKLGAALLLVVTVIVVGVASMVLVGAFIVAAVLFVVGLAARLSSGLRRVGRRDHGVAPR